jgi:hypothetical protein
MSKEPQPADRKRQEPKEMASDDLVSAFGLATRLRAHEVDWQLDAMLSRWLGNAQEELKTRKELNRVREFLPVYYDPSRRVAVFGPGAALASSGAIQAALQAVKPLRQIAG